MKKRILRGQGLILSLLCLYSFIKNDQLAAFDDVCDFRSSAFSSNAGFCEYLLLKPCVDDLDFALKSSQDVVTEEHPEGNGKFQKLDPGWKSGFRFGMSKNAIVQNFGLSFQYMYVKGEETKTVFRDEGSLAATLVHLGNVTVNSFNPNEAKAKWTLRFQSFDVFLNHPIAYEECTVFTPYFGAEGLIIHQMIKSEFIELTQSMKSRWESDSFGVGIVIGTRFDWHWLECFNFFADVSARIIRQVSDMDDHFRIELNASADQNFKFRYDECLITSGYRMAFGFEFMQEFCNLLLNIDVGYEFMSFSNIPNPRRYVTGGDGLPVSTSPSTSSLGWHGIFAGMRISF